MKIESCGNIQAVILRCFYKFLIVLWIENTSFWGFTINYGSFYYDLPSWASQGLWQRLLWFPDTECDVWVQMLHQWIVFIILLTDPRRRKGKESFDSSRPSLDWNNTNLTNGRAKRRKSLFGLIAFKIWGTLMRNEYISTQTNVGLVDSYMKISMEV